MCVCVFIHIQKYECRSAWICVYIFISISMAIHQDFDAGHTFLCRGLYTRYCNCKSCMVYVIHKGNRGGVLYYPTVVR